MSLGSRIATKARATVRVNLNSTPREPLYFLYPQWCRNSSSASASPDPEQADLAQDEKKTPRLRHTSASFSPTKAESKHHHGRPDTVKEATVDAGKEKWQATQHEARHMSVDSNSIPSAQGTGSKIIPQVKDKASDAPQNFQRAPSARKIFMVPPLPPLQAVRKVKQLMIRKARKDLAGPRKDSRPKEGDEGQLFTQRLQQMKDEVEEQPIVNWRDILSDLQQYTSPHGPWLEGALRIVVPEESTERIVNAIDGHIWETASNCNCSIKMTKAPDERDGTTFVASGSLGSLGKLIAELTLAAPNLQTYAAEQPVPDDSSRYRLREDLLHFTSSSSPTARKEVPVTDLSWPDVWTPDTFLAQVRKIHDMTNHVKRVHFKEDPNAVSWQIQKLAALFNHPNCKSSITRTAFHETLLYYIRANQIKELRNLFVGMSRIHMEMTTETFNIMLQGAAKSRNLVAFRFVLHLMLRRHCIPNYDTWFAFMESTNDVEIKRHFADAMKKKGLLGHKSAVKKLVSSMVSEEIEFSLDNNQQPKEFVDSMDARFTPLWLSVSSGARILYAYASRGLISRCWEFLHFMQSRNIHPNTVCINTVIHHCKSQGNLEGVIEFLRSLPPTSKYVPDMDTFHALFSMALEGRCYNLVRVIWRYACLYGATSFGMRRIIGDSMRKAATRPSHAANFFLKSAKGEDAARFRQYVGPVVFGNHYQGDHPMDMVRRVVDNTSDLHSNQRDGGIAGRLDSKLEFGNRELAEENMLYGTNGEDKNPFNNFVHLSGISVEGEAEPMDEAQSVSLDQSKRQEAGSPKDGHESKTGSPKPTSKSSSKPSSKNRRSWTDYLYSKQRGERKKLKADLTTSMLAVEAHSRQVGTTPAIADSRPLVRFGDGNLHFLNPRGPVFLFGDGPLNEPEVLPLGERYIPSKLKILEDITMLDLKIYQQWTPVRPMSLMLVEAAAKDRQWHRLELEVERRGEKETTIQQMYDSKERMIDDAIGIEIKTRNKPRVSRMWQ